MNLVEPHMGHWYLDRRTGKLFEVVYLDDADDSVVLQDYEGNIDEVEHNVWSALNLEVAEPPEDFLSELESIGLDEDDDVPSVHYEH